MSAQLVGILFTLFMVAVLVSIGIVTRTTADDSEERLLDRGGGQVVPVDELQTQHSLRPGYYHASLIRQSGNVYRDLGVFSTAEEALQEAAKSFHRAKVSDVRITHSGVESFAAYRQFYNFRGRAEGKKIAGVVLRRLHVDVEA